MKFHELQVAEKIANLVSELLAFIRDNEVSPMDVLTECARLCDGSTEKLKALEAFKFFDDLIKFVKDGIEPDVVQVIAFLNERHPEKLDGPFRILVADGEQKPNMRPNDISRFVQRLQEQRKKEAEETVDK